MKSHWFCGILVIAALTIPATAQSSETPQPPAVNEVIGAVPDNANIAFVLRTNEEPPLGPRDILQAYEEDMAATVLATCERFAQIASAHRQGDLSEEQAEYATRQIYALGLMQFQMLSALHEILDYKIEKDSKPGSQLDGSYGTGVPRGTTAASR